MTKYAIINSSHPALGYLAASPLNSKSALNFVCLMMSGMHVMQLSSNIYKPRLCLVQSDMYVARPAI